MATTRRGNAIPNVRLRLSNRPENVLLVREALTSLAESVDLHDGDLHDIRTAVTEACNNVVLHAYEGREGPLEVEVYASAGTIEVVVRDRGTGILPRIRTPQEIPAGIGLPVIQALVERVEFTGTAGGGTEVRMAFSTPMSSALEAVGHDTGEPSESSPEELACATEIAVAPMSLARAVLPRLLSVLAARAHFSTDRISDAQIVADALVANAPRSITGSHLSVGVSVKARSLELRVGPLRSGHAEELVTDSTVGGLAAVIERLTDDHRVTADGSSEVLALRLTDRR